MKVISNIFHIIKDNEQRSYFMGAVKVALFKKCLTRRHVMSMTVLNCVIVSWMSCHVAWKLHFILCNKNNNVKSIHVKTLVQLFDSSKAGLHNWNLWVWSRVKATTSTFCVIGIMFNIYLLWAIKTYYLLQVTEIMPLSVSACVFSDSVVCFVLIQCFPARDTGLMGFPLFSSLKTKKWFSTYIH